MTTDFNALLWLRDAARARCSKVRSGETDKTAALAELLAAAEQRGITDMETARHVIREELSSRDCGLRVPIAINYAEFLTMQFPPRELILSPWLEAGGLTLVHGWRGRGKTHIALGVGWAVATGGGFLKWDATGGARRVALLDGEMPREMLQDRLKRIVDRSELRPPLEDYLQIVAADLLPDGLPDLGNLDIQRRFYAPLVEHAELVIVDNLSTLCPNLKENDADSFAPLQTWILSLRRKGKAVVLLHHDGKDGQQRGTSKKEDVLNTVIGLRKPFDYTASQGARFEVHFEKSRGFKGPDAEPFEAWLQGDQWIVNPIKAGDDIDSLKAMQAGGMSVRDIAERTGMSKSTVSRHLNGAGN